MPTRNPTFRPAGYRPASRKAQPYDAGTGTGFYHSPEWKAAKAAVARRSGGRCERTTDGLRCGLKARTVNHKDRSKVGVMVPLDQLEHLCAGCDNRFHSEKGSHSAH